MIAAKELGARYLSSGFMCFPSVRYYFATINIGNMNASGPGPAVTRNKITGTFLANLLPHLMFFQEFTKLGPLTKKWAIYGLKASYRYIGDSQASILYDSDVLELHPFSQESMDILDKADDLVTSRLTICVLEDKVDKVKFIAASWHGQYKITEETKVERLKELKKIMEEIQKAEGIDHIILSGDFNLQVEKAEDAICEKAKDAIGEKIEDAIGKKAEDEIGQSGGLKIHQYKGIIRIDKDVIDFVVTSKNFPLEGLTAHKVEADGIKGIKNIKEIFDHDPFTGSFDLKPIEKDDL